jgi:hypothetical protein
MHGFRRYLNQETAAQVGKKGAAPVVIGAAAREIARPGRYSI